MPTCYPAHVLTRYCQPVPVQNSDGKWCPTVTLPMFCKDTVNLSLFKTLMGIDAHLLPCPCSEKYCQPVPVQNSDGNWCPPVTLPMFWQGPVPVKNSDGNWCPPVTLPMFWKDIVNLSLLKTLVLTGGPALKRYCQPVPIRTAHVLKRYLSISPCSKLWKLMALLLNDTDNLSLYENLCR